MSETPDSPNRRPIRARSNPLIGKLASRLAASDITPDQISLASVGFAGLGLLFLWAAAVSGLIGQSLLLILAALTVQLRLLCNLIDGMVAVEGGKSSARGAFWNEAPDRAADLLFFWGAGLFAGSPALGLGCGALAVLTAYLREFGRAEGFTPDFRGPMAKPHRMAALTLACLMAALLPIGYTGAVIMQTALWLIAGGILATIARRALRLLEQLDARG
ncbi:CDP-alcohol phosphatidyltransferase family protein [Pseudogemmobacter humi]|uniref:CDP-alcohol phosphatidyltransferase n=1 Tax=Pseudogemmobacter humi TaxID=2483812 RepID=A0A3P5XJG8_9RHOB|nr:CDP-alcohol phosphatidyltransferase family protein [Pseudogemmobacter humi]VDC31774.1 CDP-alcohol phosphatidyltransferase [Pseudogemmobacter humi]